MVASSGPRDISYRRNIQMRFVIFPGDEPDPEYGEHIATITPEEIDSWVAEAIAAKQNLRRDTLTQQIVDRAVRILHHEGETYLAASLLALMAFRVANREAEALSALLQLVAEDGVAGMLDRKCRICGCTQEFGCEGGGSWAEFDLCSSCNSKLKKIGREGLGQ